MLSIAAAGRCTCCSTLFFLTLLARFVMGAVLQYGRRWQPGRGAAAALEVGVERH